MGSSHHDPLNSEDAGKQADFKEGRTERENAAELEEASVASSSLQRKKRKPAASEFEHDRGVHGLTNRVDKLQIEQRSCPVEHDQRDFTERVL